MPTESMNASPSGGGPSLPPPAALKCTMCGAASLSPVDGVVILGEEIERVCASCVRASCAEVPPTGLGLDGLTGLSARLASLSTDRMVCSEPVMIDLERLHARQQHARRGSSARASSPPVTCSSNAPGSVGIPMPAVREQETAVGEPTTSMSLPSSHAAPWATAQAAQALAVPAPGAVTPPDSTRSQADAPPNPLLDVGRLRQRSVGRGCLYPGSIFRGSQSSGRNAYQVEVRILDVNFDNSTLCGYLSIEGLTEAYPHLTTFFDGEIIGPNYGFVTGTRYGANESHDMSHWERFDQFRRPSTKADIINPGMLFRDPLPDTARGETYSRERDFVFLRIKERFLVPDHHKRDINGASFAGFYYAMVDMSPTLQQDDVVPSSPVLSKSPKPVIRRLSSVGPRPDMPRRQSTSAPNDSPRRPSVSAGRPNAARRQSSSRPGPAPRAATLRGYYFHSLNNEPFQELSLVHEPSHSAGAFELR